MGVDTAPSSPSSLSSESQEYLQEHALPAARALIAPYAEVEHVLCQLITLHGLDRLLKSDKAVEAQAARVEEAVEQACAFVYTKRGAEVLKQGEGLPINDNAAHLFLQRVLYRINRLNHFWFDSVHNYVNERSPWLAALRDKIEASWQAFELLALPVPNGLPPDYQKLSQQQIKEGLSARYLEDVDPSPGPSLQYITEAMSRQGYAHLLAIGSLDGLVEASRQSRVCAGTANEISAAVFRVLLEEYGGGRLPRKHSTFYQQMMLQLELRTVEEGYLELVPWQALASANHNFLLTERRRNYLRYAGGLSFFEINGPAVYRAYLAAAQRLSLGEGASAYWALHIKEDERHGRQMLEEVALPLVDRYPLDGWEVLWGYDQEKAMGARAGAAVAAAIAVAEQHAGIRGSGQGHDSQEEGGGMSGTRSSR